MSAKEMFKILGYVDYEEDESKIVYGISFRLNFGEIVFRKLFKTIEITGKSHDYSTGIIDYKELQAINKQVEELGWNSGIKNLKKYQ